MVNNGLPFEQRLGLWRAGLGTADDAEALISESITRNLMHYLPADLHAEASRRLQAGKLKFPISSVN